MDSDPEKNALGSRPQSPDRHVLSAETMADLINTTSSPYSEDRLDTDGSTVPGTIDDDNDSSYPPSDAESDVDHPRDGHRPTMLEIRLSRPNSIRSRGHSRVGSKVSSVGHPLGEIPTANSIAGPLRYPLSNIASSVRSRINKQGQHKFAHPLTRTPTSKSSLVDFDGPDDPYRPINWPLRKKIITTFIYGLITMSATWASSAYSPGTVAIAAEFHVSTPVSILGTSLFLASFGLGPLLWAPLSEVYGRKIAVLVPMFIAICFSFGSATAKDFQTLMITRFWCGFFASAPVTNTGGVLGDLYSPTQRGIAMAGYAMSVVSGPVLGPIVSTALVVDPNLGWRWTEYLTGIIQIVTLLLGVMYVEESYPPVLLVYKARRLRIESGNWALHTKFEEWDVSISELAHKFLCRPVQLLCTPICFLVALHASFCYGILYMQLGSVPIIFMEVRGWKPFIATLPFLSILLGAIIGCGINIYNQMAYNKYFHAAGNRPVPEKRLPAMMVGSVFFASGLFVTGWTADPEIHWIVPCIGLVMLGTGFFTILQAALNYLVDTFTRYAASAVAANTFLRSCFACAFPLVVGPLYHNLGVGPGSSICAGFAILMIPVPFIFYRYGKQIRASSKWSRDSVHD
ncbi:Major facilitator superfamily domain containing protein [Rhypophila decipiens]